MACRIRKVDPFVFTIDYIPFSSAETCNSRFVRFPLKCMKFIGCALRAESVFWVEDGKDLQKFIDLPLHEILSIRTWILIA